MRKLLNPNPKMLRTCPQCHGTGIYSKVRKSVMTHTSCNPCMGSGYRSKKVIA